MTLPRWIATIAFAACTLAAAAVPTVDAVQAEVQRGNFAQAETMMQQVIAARPGSARAHYIYAEILARNKRFDQAATEVARARQIDPAIGFTDPAKFGALEQLLQREQAAARPVAVQPAPTGRALPAPVQPAQVQPVPTADSGVPSWAWALGLGGLAALAWSLLRRRPQPVAGAAGPMGSMAGPVGAGGAPQGYGQAPAFGQAPAYGQPPGYGQAPGYGQPSGMGGGLMGVGLAAAGGVAAGMLVEKLLHGGHDSAAAQAVNPAANPAASGLVPGLFDEPADNAAARELAQRPVDFGSGGSAADSADGGWGGGDSGGSDDSSDGW